MKKHQILTSILLNLCYLSLAFAEPIGVDCTRLEDSGKIFYIFGDESVKAIQNRTKPKRNHSSFNRRGYRNRQHLPDVSSGTTIEIGRQNLGGDHQITHFRLIRPRRYVYGVEYEVAIGGGYDQDGSWTTYKTVAKTEVLEVGPNFVDLSTKSDFQTKFAPLHMKIASDKFKHLKEEWEFEELTFSYDPQDSKSALAALYFIEDLSNQLEFSDQATDRLRGELSLLTQEDLVPHILSELSGTEDPKTLIAEIDKFQTFVSDEESVAFLVGKELISHLDSKIQDLGISLLNSVPERDKYYGAAQFELASYFYSRKDDSPATIGPSASSAEPQSLDPESDDSQFSPSKRADRMIPALKHLTQGNIQIQRYLDIPNQYCFAHDAERRARKVAFLKQQKETNEDLAQRILMDIRARVLGKTCLGQRFPIIATPTHLEETASSIIGLIELMAKTEKDQTSSESFQSLMQERDNLKKQNELLLKRYSELEERTKVHMDSDSAAATHDGKQ